MGPGEWTGLVAEREIMNSVSNDTIRGKLPTPNSATDMARAFATQQAGIDKSLEEFGRGVRYSKQEDQDADATILDALRQLSESHRELVRAVVEQGELANRSSAENTTTSMSALFWSRMAFVAALLSTAASIAPGL